MECARRGPRSYRYLASPSLVAGHIRRASRARDSICYNVITNLVERGSGTMTSGFEEKGAPRYWQLAERLRQQIADGRYPEGAQFPTEEALGREFGVSRITVRAALDRLATEGLLRRERGRGTFVAAPPIEHDLGQLTDFAEDMAVVGMRPASRVTHFAEEPVPEEFATLLGVAPETTITRI